jgi:site-specific DNA recombinase
MSAARRKGKWIGGVPLLGYDIDPGGGKLVTNAKEAQRVREIFDLYLKHRSVPAVVAELVRRCWHAKVWKSQAGRTHAGGAFTKASLRRLLTNATYAGVVEHRGHLYKGEQQAIIDRAVWDQVNGELRAGRRHADSAVRMPQNALLAGLLRCASCNQPMIPTYTAKPGRRYRYYVCRSAPAEWLERLRNEIGFRSANRRLRRRAAAHSHR